MPTFKISIFPFGTGDIMESIALCSVDLLDAMRVQSEIWNDRCALSDRLTSRLYDLSGSPRRWRLISTIGF